MPAPSAIGRTNQRVRRASTAAPPANANTNGRNPAARRDCETETRSEKWVNAYGHSSSASTSSVPPSTYALQRRRPANAASGTSSRAAIAIAPDRETNHGPRW
jgi:hypothetical protein